MNFIKMLPIIAIAFAGVQAIADEGSSSASSNEVARQQLSLKCNISKTNGGTTDCSINLKAKGKHVISMEPAKEQKGGTVGFVGVDAVTEPGGQYLLILSADTNATLNS